MPSNNILLSSVSTYTSNFLNVPEEITSTNNDPNNKTNGDDYEQKTNKSMNYMSRNTQNSKNAPKLVSGINSFYFLYPLRCSSQISTPSNSLASIKFILFN